MWHQGKYGSQPAKMDPIWWVDRCPRLTYQNQSSSLKVFFPFIMKLWTCDGYWPNVSWSRHSSVTFFWWYVVIYCDILWHIAHHCTQILCFFGSLKYVLQTLCFIVCLAVFWISVIISQFRVSYIKCYIYIPFIVGICVDCIIPQLVVSSPRNHRGFFGMVQAA